MEDRHREILLICQEECAEVTQAISKVFRFGIDVEYNNKTNRNRLTEEVGDLLCMIKLMVSENIIDELEVNEASNFKFIKLKNWSKIMDKI